MSQHLLKTDKYHVLCGWDRPLSGFYLVIEEKGIEEPVYTNLEERIAHPKTFYPFVKVLARYGIELPANMLFTIELDAAANAGNTRAYWSTNSIHCLAEFPMHGCYTSVWENGEVKTGCYVNTESLSVYDLQSNDVSEEYTNLREEFVVVQIMGQNITLEAKEGQLTQKGRDDLSAQVDRLNAAFNGESIEDPIQ